MPMSEAILDEAVRLVVEEIERSHKQSGKFLSVYQFTDKHGKRHLIPYDSWTHWAVLESNLVLNLRPSCFTDKKEFLIIEYDSEEEALKQANLFIESWGK